MFSLKFKILLTGSLLLVTVVLVVIKLTFGSDEESTGFFNPADTLKAEHYKSIIPGEIDTILYSFGITNSWIKNSPAEVKQDKKNKQVKKETTTAVTENLWFYKEVLIPEDFSVSALNYELTNFFRAMKLAEISNEDPKTRDLSMDVYYAEDSTKKVLGKVKLIYSDKITRGGAEVCIILNNVKQYTAAELEKILGSPEKFSMVLPINFENSDIQSSIVESGKDYLLYYSLGNENDFEADFRTDMDEKQWKAKVRSVSVEFPESSGILIADRRELFKFESDLIDHFAKYRENVFRDSVLIKFSPPVEGDKKIYDLFSSILTASASGRKSLIYLVDFTAADFQNYVSEVYNMKKRGYKFTSFKEIIRNRTKKKDTASEKLKSDSLDAKGEGKIIK